MNEKPSEEESDKAANRLFLADNSKIKLLKLKKSVSENRIVRLAKRLAK